MRERERVPYFLHKNFQNHNVFISIKELTNVSLILDIPAETVFWIYSILKNCSKNIKNMPLSQGISDIYLVQHASQKIVLFFRFFGPKRNRTQRCVTS